MHRKQYIRFKTVVLLGSLLLAALTAFGSAGTDKKPDLRPEAAADHGTSDAFFSQEAVADQSKEPTVNDETRMPELVLQTPHSSGVSSVAFSDHGLLAKGSYDLASAGYDETVKLWDPRSRQVLRTLSTTAAVTSLTFSPDGNLLAGGTWPGEIDLWSVRTGQYLGSLKGHREAVYSVAFSPDGKFLASGSWDKTARLWNVADRIELRKFDHPGPVSAIAFNRDGRLLASGEGAKPQNQENWIRIWEVPSGQLKGILQGHSDSIWGLSFSPSDDRLLASGSLDHTLKIWKAPSQDEQGKLITTLTTDAAVHALAFSSRTEWLAVANDKVDLVHWSAAQESIKPAQLSLFPDNRPLQTKKTVHVNSIAFSPDGRWLATGTWEDGVTLWEVSTRRLLGSSGILPSVGWLAYGGERWLATSGMEGTIGLWDLIGGSKVATLKGHNSPIESLAFGPSGHLLASGSRDGAVKIWDTESLIAQPRELLKPGVPTEDFTFDFSPSAVHALAFSPDGQWLASGGEDNTIRVWNLLTKEEPSLLVAHTGPIQALAFNRDGILASGGKDRTVRLWHFVGGLWKPFATLPWHSGSVQALSFSSNGRLLVGGIRSEIVDRSNIVRVWDLKTNSEPLRFLNEYGVESVAFSPDDRWLAAISQQKQLFLWNASIAGLPVRVLLLPAATRSMAFSHDGRWLFVAAGSGVVRVYLIDASGSSKDSSSMDKSPVSEMNTTIAKIYGRTPVVTLAAILVAMGQGSDWAVVSSDGLFDGSTSGMEKVAWRNSDKDRIALVPLDTFFEDFFEPGLLNDLTAGHLPRAPLDIATLLPMPGWRAMVRNKLLHFEENKDSQVYACFKQWPTAIIPMDPNPNLPGCPNAMPLHTKGSPEKLISTLNRPPERYRSPWDGKKAPDTAGSTLHVLTVGIDNYAKPDLQQLPRSVASANEVADFFGRQRISSNKIFEDIRIWDTIANKPPLRDTLATRDAIRDRLREMAASMKGDDVVFLFFSGHGEVPEGQQMFYFYPSDVITSDQTIPENGLSTAMLAEAIRDMPARRIVLIIDACQSGGALDSLEKIAQLKVKTEIQLAKTKPNAKQDNEVGVVISAATTPVQLGGQYKNLPVTPLTRALLDALKMTLAKGEHRIWMQNVLRHMQRSLGQGSKVEKGGLSYTPLFSSTGADFPVAATE